METENNDNGVAPKVSPFDKNLTPWKQQQMPVWQPIINGRTAWKPLLALGLGYISLGIILVLTTGTAEVRVTYAGDDNIRQCNHCVNKLKVQRIKGACAGCLGSWGSGSDCICEVGFEIRDKLNLPVYVYYELEDFYQNHRRVVKSRDDYQLLGLIVDENKMLIPPRDSCRPFDYASDGKIYFPCGATANSMFSDAFEIKHYQRANGAGFTETYLKMNEGKISWISERRYKFRNPKTVSPKTYKNDKIADTKLFQTYFTQPLDWSKDTYDDWWKDGGLENQHFINWMHPAPFSTFRKLYGVIESSSGCNEDKTALCTGDYTLKIKYRFDVDRFNGSKHLILTTTSWLGTSKSFLDWFTIGVGIICVIMGGVCRFTEHYYKSRNPHYHHPRHSSDGDPPSDNNDGNPKNEQIQERPVVGSNGRRKSKSD